MTRRRFIADEVSGDRATLVGEHAHHLARVLRARIGQDFDLAIFKFDRMEWAIEKCTELGVSRIVPAIARRTDSRLAAASAKRVERWQRIARQASEQSRRADAPEIARPIKLSEAFTLPAVLRIVLAESEEQTLLRDVVKPQTANGGIVLAIGPEGGWTEDELESFRQAAWISASLGNTILRAETAAMAATAIVASALCWPLMSLST